MRPEHFYYPPWWDFDITKRITGDLLAFSLRGPAQLSTLSDDEIKAVIKNYMTEIHASKLCIPSPEQVLSYWLL